MKKIIKLFLFSVITNITIISFLYVEVNAKESSYYLEDIKYFDPFTEENIEDYDLYHLISLDETYTLKNWLIEEYEFKLDKEKDLEFINNNISKFVLLAMQKGIIKNYYANDDYSILWFGTQHNSITYQAIAYMLPNDNKDSAYNFFLQYISILLEYSKKPDEDEAIGGTHYYITYNETPSNVGDYYQNRNDNYSRSARTRFEDHYSNAINLYENGEYTLAMQFLGRALHYIEDIGAAPHAAGVSDADDLLTNPHHFYENWLANNYDQFKRYTSTKYDYVLNNSFASIINGLAEIAGSYKEFIDKDNCYLDIFFRTQCNTTKYYEITENTLPLTQEIVAGILNRFYQEIKYPTYYIKKGTIYNINNYLSNYYFDVENSGTSIGTDIQQYSYTGGTNQQFIVYINNNDGTFYLKPKSDLTKALTVNNSGILELDVYDSSDINQKFRFTHIDNGYYRLMTGSSGFAEVIGVGSPFTDAGNDLEEYWYNPDSVDQLWKFEKGETIPFEPFKLNQDIS